MKVNAAVSLLQNLLLAWSLHVWALGTRCWPLRSFHMKCNWNYSKIVVTWNGTNSHMQRSLPKDLRLTWMSSFANSWVLGWCFTVHSLTCLAALVSFVVMQRERLFMLHSFGWFSGLQSTTLFRSLKLLCLALLTFFSLFPLYQVTLQLGQKFWAGHHWWLKTPPAWTRPRTAVKWQHLLIPKP